MGASCFCLHVRWMIFNLPYEVITIAGWLHAGGDQGQGGQELRHRGLQLHEEAVRQPPFCFFVKVYYKVNMFAQQVFTSFYFLNNIFLPAFHNLLNDLKRAQVLL